MRKIAKSESKRCVSHTLEPALLYGGTTGIQTLLHQPAHRRRALFGKQTKQGPVG
jgi:hypothetical protein